MVGEEQEKDVKHCCEDKSTCGPGYATPMDAFRSRDTEKILYIPCIVPGKDRPDYLATIDVDPASENFAKVIHRTPMPNLGDEIHHSGWNACSSCYDKPSTSRSHLVLPAINSSRIYFIDVKTDPKAPRIDKVIEPEHLFALKCSSPHTAHCLANGEVMISCMGDGPSQNGRGSFLLVDGATMTTKGTWAASEDDVPPFGYDFWYQPYHNVMISSEWGDVKCLKDGLNLEDVTAGKYGTHLNIFDWTKRKLIQRINLGSEGVMPLEVRFLHDPRATVGFVGSALFGNVFKFFKKDDGTWDAKKVIDIPSKKVDGWVLDEMPSVLTDILISLDDKYLYMSNWLHGDIRQYDITDTDNPRLTGQIFIGGSVCEGTGLTVLRDQELERQPQPRVVQGKVVNGGPQMIQLSLDGRRLYVTTSLFSSWDKQFYPQMFEDGSFLLRVDVDHENGGMALNEDFSVDFGNEPDGPVLAHEVRYPGGDCTSDIYLDHTKSLPLTEG